MVWIMFLFYVILAQESDTEQLRNKLCCWGWRWDTEVWLRLSERTTGAWSGPGAIPSLESCPEGWLPSACVWPGSHTHETAGDYDLQQTHKRPPRSAIKKEWIIDTCYGMYAKNTMWCERSQIQETIYCMIPFISNVQKREIHRDRK